MGVNGALENGYKGMPYFSNKPVCFCFMPESCVVDSVPAHLCPQGSLEWVPATIGQFPEVYRLQEVTPNQSEGIYFRRLPRV